MDDGLNAAALAGSIYRPVQGLGGHAVGLLLGLIAHGAQLELGPQPCGQHLWHLPRPVRWLCDN
jgi:hypothetical protein